MPLDGPIRRSVKRRISSTSENDESVWMHAYGAVKARVGECTEQLLLLLLLLLLLVLVLVLAGAGAGAGVVVAVLVAIIAVMAGGRTTTRGRRSSARRPFPLC